MKVACWRTILNRISPFRGNCTLEHSNARALVKKHSFTMFYTNADALINKLHDLEERITETKPDVIAITEVLPKRSASTISDSDLQLNNYELF